MATAERALTLPRLRGLRVAVVGDFMGDEYLYGQTERISREAPVPIVSFERGELKLGGAGNVAANLAALGVRVTAVGLLGRDVAGRQIRALCAGAGIGVGALELRPELESPVKTRILAGALHTTRQQLLRLDRGRAVDDAALRARVVRAVEALLSRVDALVVSDYGGGVAGPELARRAGQWAKRLPVCVDSRFSLGRFLGVTVAKPNVPELSALAGGPIAGERELVRIGRALLREKRFGALLVTRGRDGLALLRAGGPPRFWPVHGPSEAVDVTGAGDTVLAAFAAVLAATGEPLLAAELANVAGGLVVQKPGTATVTAAELAAALQAPDLRLP
ncbi:MAG: bifunctional heptose 7-phosphate kinase/heptose 1-phosphate adenyltransferase [Deltaproteobacteria bacterium]